MAKRDLAGHRHEADQSQGPGGFTGAESDLDQILRLMDLHRVPGEQAAEIAERDPPETAGEHSAAQRPIDRRPGVVDDVAVPAGVRGPGALAIRFEAEILGPSSQ